MHAASALLVTATAWVDGSSEPLAPTLPANGIVLWQTIVPEGATVVLLQSAAVWDTDYGHPFRNVSGPLVAPAESELCQPPLPEWAGRIVLGSDWTSPGCSMQHRAHLLQDAGVLGVLFKGTEATGFTADDFSGRADLPVAIVAQGDYLILSEAVLTHNTSMGWVTGAASPLRQSEPFAAFVRTLQGLVLVVAAINVWVALKQLRAFGVFSKAWRRGLCAAESDPQAKDKGPAVPVIALNLMATISNAAHTIEAGPTIEAPFKPLLPFLYSRILLDIGFQLQVIGTLLLSAHFRKIVRGIDRMINGDGGKASKPQAAERSRRASTSVRSSISGAFSRKKRSSTIDMDDLASGKSNSKIPWDIVFMIALVGTVLMQFVSAVLTGLFIANELFTTVVVLLSAFILTSIGLWFRHYANKVIGLMKASTGVSKGLQDRIDRLSRNVRKLGTCMVGFVVLQVIVEGMRIALSDTGGWIYWGVLCLLQCIGFSIVFLLSNLQMRAFQAPSQTAGKDSGQRKETVKPGKIVALEESSFSGLDIIPVRVVIPVTTAATHPSDERVGAAAR